MQTLSPRTESPVRAAIGPLVLALAGGGAIWLLATPYFTIWSGNDDPAFAISVAAALGLATLVLRRSTIATSYQTVTASLFVAATAMAVLVVGPFNGLVSGPVGSIEHAVRDKLAQFLAVVPPILLLTWLLRRPWSSLYLGLGRTRQWLVLGGISVAVAAVVFGGIALAQGAEWEDLRAVAPGLFLFAALNAFMEELWFRGVFLDDYTAVFGPNTAIVVTAIVFGAAHLGATYISPAQQLGFAALVIGLGLALAWLIRWGRSIWGAVLFHLGLDLVLVFEFLDLG